MERTDLTKVLAGFGLAALLAGVAVAGCSNAQKSSWTGGKSGAGGTEQQQKTAPSSWGGTKGAGGAGGSWGGTKK